MASNEPIVCPTCGGQKVLIPVFARFKPGTTPEQKAALSEFPCPTCDGAGTISQARQEALAEGQFLKHARLRKQLGLRHCAELMGVLPSVLCNAENGRTTWALRQELMKQIEALPSKETSP